jgi:hypothetical protein
LGAWSSNQSHKISSREALEEQEREVKERFQHVEVVPRPPHWGGYRLVPTRVEFWKVIRALGAKGEGEGGYCLLACVTCLLLHVYMSLNDVSLFMSTKTAYLVSCILSWCDGKTNTPTSCNTAVMCVCLCLF